MMKKKAIFFDIDSTLYAHRMHEIPQSAQQTLWKLKKQGHYVAIATSRCRYEIANLPKFFREFPFDGYIFDGGALAIVNGNVMHAQQIALETVHKLVQLSRKLDFVLRYSTFDEDYYDRRVSHKVRDSFFHLYLNMPLVKEYENEETFNLLAYVHDKKHRMAIHELEDEFLLTKHSDEVYEITAKGVDKSGGVNAACSYWQIPLQDTICVGDGVNDVRMLEMAGIGIAMGNGDERAKTAADMICPDIEENGIQQAFEALEMLEEEKE